jgi:hypothetical protein
VTFDGLSLRTPASWPVVNLALHPSACPRLDVHAVYLGTAGPDPACPAGLRGKTEAVQIEPANPRSPDVRQARRPVLIGGRVAASTNADSASTHTIIYLIPAAGLEVSLSYGGDPALARRIAASILVGPAARAAALPGLAAVRPGPMQGYFRGSGFDTCTAPSATALGKWLSSRYRAIGIYIGGVNRACAQASLTAAWITAIRAQGWHYFPLYPGLQASCVLAARDATIKPADAAAEGTAAADDAATQAQDLGIPPGTPIIYDMEAYAGCGAEVTTFLSSWDSGLHAWGFRAAVYESVTNIGDLVRAAGTMTEPDVIHYADWDGHATTMSPYMPAGMWRVHQRIHQYRGGHNETWGGIAMNIDSDRLNVSLGLAWPRSPAGSAAGR